MKWFQCFMCGRLGLLVSPTELICSTCGSPGGKAFKSEELEEAIRLQPEVKPATKQRPA
jgi:hypothetical protein